MARSNVPQPIRDAAERAVTSLLAQPDLVAMVAAAEIQRQVNSGALIPLSRLQMGPGLELAPRGRIVELETAVQAALDGLSDPRGAHVDEARALLTDVLPAPTPSSAPPGSNLVVDETPPDEPARAAPDQATNEPDEDEPHWLADKSFNGGGDGKPLPKEPDGRPTDMPTETRQCEAEGCGKDVSASEGQMSFTRFRRVLCREHFVNYKADQPA